MLIARHTAPDAASLGESPMIALSPLDGGQLTCFETVATASPGTDTYERVIATQGTWTKPAGFAVFASWQVNEPEKCAAFEESRRQLFEVRRQHLGTFAFDWLLKHCSIPGRYCVLGLYGDEEGASTLCRLHPEVQRFAQAHPPSEYGAREVSGLCVCRVERSTI